MRGAVIIGERFAAVWDSLAHPGDVAAISSILGDKPFFVLYSHADWDHCWGTCGLPRAPINIVAHAECRHRFDHDVPATLSRMRQADPGKWEAVRLVPPNLTFRQSLTLDLGGVSLQLHHLPGHTEDCIVGWIPERGVLLGGDTIETPFPVVNSAESVDLWLASLEAWAERDDLTQAIPSHGALKGRSAFTQTIAYLRALTGRGEFDLPATLDSFYSETHQKNLKIVAGGIGADE